MLAVTMFPSVPIRFSAGFCQGWPGSDVSIPMQWSLQCSVHFSPISLCAQSDLTNSGKPKFLEKSCNSVKLCDSFFNGCTYHLWVSVPTKNCEHVCPIEVFSDGKKVSVATPSFSRGNFKPLNSALVVLSHVGSSCHDSCGCLLLYQSKIMSIVFVQTPKRLCIVPK